VKERKYFICEQEKRKVWSNQYCNSWPLTFVKPREDKKPKPFAGRRERLSMSMNGLLELVGLRSIIALTTSTAPFWLCVLILLLSLPSPFFSFLFNFPLVLIQTTTLTGRDEYARTIHFTGSWHHCEPTTRYIKDSTNRLPILRYLCTTY
jgi:hypothetical protein